VRRVSLATDERTPNGIFGADHSVERDVKRGQLLRLGASTSGLGLAATSRILPTASEESHIGILGSDRRSEARSVADLVWVVNFAGPQPALAVRGGGHSAAKSGVCDRELMIDLSHVDGIRLDPVPHNKNQFYCIPFRMVPPEPIVVLSH
jgi:hypothetical protein